MKRCNDNAHSFEERLREVCADRDSYVKSGASDPQLVAEYDRLISRLERNLKRGQNGKKR
jgi:hypothetical protein